MSGMSFVSQGVRFLGEQDGQPERNLKEALKPLLADDRQVARAYLAQVQLAEADLTSVALAIVRDGGESHKLNLDIATVFQGLFSSKNFLDVVFVSSLEEADLMLVCEPFYVRSATPKGWIKKLFN